MMGCILLWVWYNIRGLMTAGLKKALKLIEGQKLDACGDVCYSEIDRISEACWMLWLLTCHKLEHLWKCCIGNLVSV